jgi:type I restriction-modification system DNA methylase subunit
MRLTQGEIRSNAIRFAADWKDAANEQAEAQSFWTDLFAVYGIKRRSVASFEEKVRNLKGAYSRIDVFYAGVMLGEHKSRGEDLTKAQSQAFDYVQSLTREGRHSEVPQYIVLSDFETIVVFDLDAKDPSGPVARFPTAKLHENTRQLGFLAGQTTRPIDPEDPINIDAVEILGRLHDTLEEAGYTGHALERFLVRILFCLFADDTGILEPDAFKAIVKESREDGFGLGALLNQVFEVLDTPKNDPQRKGLPEEFANLPYVNGQLFAERLPAVNFSPATRAALLEACDFNWSRISPAVFGSLFQSIMAGEEGARKRRQIGAHYTSERDIMKLIRSLFLDDLETELEKAKTKPELTRFQDKLASLKFLDPACGCGNFLVVAYRELRRLEIEMLEKFHAKQKGEIQQILNLDALLKVNVDQMHGIEIEEWPARIAEVAMWLVDHQMNTRAGEIFGQPVLRLPLTKSAKIVHANALRTDWNKVLPASECSFVLGNPPFIGHQWRDEAQQADMDAVWDGVHKQYGRLDYVCCWYLQAARYLTDGTAAFVSTNSISQGEQARILSACLFGPLVHIHFAHRTFTWISEARGKAHVHVVIVGFSLTDRKPKTIVTYDESESEDGVAHTASNINAYLIDGPDVVLESRAEPIDPAIPPMNKGSQPTDGGHLILDREEGFRLIDLYPDARKWLRQYMGGRELINSEFRWCLWLEGITSQELRAMPQIAERVEQVRKSRLKSPTKSVRDATSTPTLFTQNRQPPGDFLAIPEVSSETRDYIPIAFLSNDVVPSNKIQIIPSATVYIFGVLTSLMHMSWMRTIAGRLKSDYSYSPAVLHNFPWPQSPTGTQKSVVEAAAQAVLDTRDKFPSQSFADLYDPLAMPKPLRDAHRALDRAVDRCYRKHPFDSERARVEFLFDLYQKLTAPLTTTPKPKRRGRAAKPPATP